MKPITDIMSRMGAPRERGSENPYAGGVQCEHGWFSMDELIAVGARFLYDRNGERVIQFPQNYTHNRDPFYRDIPDYVVDQHEREGER